MCFLTKNFEQLTSLYTFVPTKGAKKPLGNKKSATIIIYPFNPNLLIILFMNKTELVSAIAAKAGLTKVDAKKALDATIAAITDELKKGEKVSLIGFGTFAVAARPARQGINPLNKKPITIAAKKLAKFKAGTELDAAIQ